MPSQPLQIQRERSKKDMGKKDYVRQKGKGRNEEEKKKERRVRKKIKTEGKKEE